MTDLWRLTATEVVRQLWRRELSLLEMVEAAALRIEMIEQNVNALPIRFFDQARDYQGALKMRVALTLAGSQAYRLLSRTTTM
jgi:Asp-tRNA(Asn)/Glu-tRNA(Gln) amidotransferase A subunit family amidase